MGVNVNGRKSWPLRRYHPVFESRMFADANEYDAAGGDDGDWRFATAGEADAARTETEAQLVAHMNARRKLDGLIKVNEGTNVLSNSAQAHESARSGYPELGVVLPGEDAPKAV